MHIIRYDLPTVTSFQSAKKTPVERKMEMFIYIMLAAKILWHRTCTYHANSVNPMDLVNFRHVHSRTLHLIVDKGALFLTNIDVLMIKSKAFRASPVKWWHLHLSSGWFLTVCFFEISCHFNTYFVWHTKYFFRITYASFIAPIYTEISSLFKEAICLRIKSTYQIRYYWKYPPKH